MATTTNTQNKCKNGFTLVELLVTIAIAAVLATVSIAGFATFLSSAKRSADEQTAAQMNILLAASEVLESPAHISDVQSLFKAEAVTELDTQSENSAFYWVAGLNRVVIWERDDENSTQGKVVFPDDSAKSFENVTEIPAGWYALKSKYLKEGDGEAEFFELIRSAQPHGDTISLLKDTALKVDALEMGNALAAQSTGIGETKSITLNLNGGTLQIGESDDGKYYSFPIVDNMALEITNGNIELLSSNSKLLIKKNASLYLYNTKLNAEFGEAIVPQRNANAVTIENSEITSGTFSVFAAKASKDLKITIANSIIDGETAVFASTPCEINISQSTIKGHKQAIVLRGCTAFLTDNKIYNFPTDIDWNKHLPEHSTPNWSSLNNVPVAAITIGNNVGSATLKHSSECVMKNNTVHIIEGYMAIYIEGMSEENYAELTVSGGRYFYHSDDSCQDGTEYGSDSPVMYNESLHPERLKKDAAIIYSSNPNSYVTVNGDVCRAPAATE